MIARRDELQRHYRGPVSVEDSLQLVQRIAPFETRFGWSALSWRSRSNESNARKIIALVALLRGVTPVWGLTINERMTLIEAIEAVRNEGYRISYSTRLVQSWMRVRSDASNDDPIEALRAVLTSYSLDVQPEGRRLGDRCGRTKYGCAKTRARCRP